MPRLLLGLLLSLPLQLIASEATPNLGVALSAEEVAALDFVVLPDGDGLPAGAGSAEEGADAYRENCLACHGEQGVGGANDRLAGGHGTLQSARPTKTVGSYWPYSTTVFDYVRRAMPYASPGQLTNDELYEITAYLLHINGIVEVSEVMDAASLPRVKMPNRNNFIWAVGPEEE